MIPRSYLDSIKSFEGFTSVARWDYAQNSNGFGTRALFPGEKINAEEAHRRFLAEIASAAAVVDKFAPDLPEGTRAALASLTFNAGAGWTKSGLGAAVVEGDLAKAKALFLQYNKAGGEILPGLVSRRMAEATWFDLVPKNTGTVEPNNDPMRDVATRSVPRPTPPGPVAQADLIVPFSAGVNSDVMSNSNEHAARSNGADDLPAINDAIFELLTMLATQISTNDIWTVRNWRKMARDEG